MWPAIKTALPAVLATAASTAGNIFGARDTQRRAMENWRIQQEYNLPENQMKRLQDAGINPHLAFGKGSISNVSPGQPQTPELKVDTGLTEMVKYQQVSNLRAQNNLLRAQAEKQYAEAEVAKRTVEDRVTEIGSTAYKRQAEHFITEMEEIQKRFGVEKADPMIKILFQDWWKQTYDHFDPETKQVMKATMTEDDVRKWLKGVTITREVAKALTALGFGRLLSRYPTINRSR